MTLPALHALEDCADFSKTVEPFIPQLLELPTKLLAVVQSRGTGFLDLYLHTNPLVSGFAVSLALGAVFFVVSEINRNYSQVDRCWSILPTLYIAHFGTWARLNGVASTRLDAAVLFSTIWSLRLTFNYARKGGYSIGSEDYRWEVVRKRIPAWLFHIFNLTFISFIQSVLLFALAAPAYLLLLSTQFEKELSHADIAFVAVELGLILTEWFSDQQQWDYQSAKKQYQKTAKVPKGYTQAEMDRGFVTSGLWGYIRHPNFAAEQTIWFLFYQWGCFATKSLYNWAGAGPAFLIMLFQGSTWLTELLTAGKYPEYADYQNSVGMFMPTSFSPYKTPAPKVPKIIRTSELAKKHKQKQK
ncbi:DUF1295-domain-containing protein [Pleurostoma richardsiae]|uniref:DUF1295-domain-containing protein n=1 Tax=Pleurostoma richardsiae TaxID=41990 RepID=A0AA38VND3_9PEZI|nr:DUF1295-domain-containing protein [Pleurostoma richardsiae]